jgi:hypothetical protein
MDNTAKFKRADRIKKIISEIDSRMLDIQTLKGGLIMHRNVFRAVLYNHPSLKNEFSNLENRRFALKKALWKLP